MLQLLRQPETVGGESTIDVRPTVANQVQPCTSVGTILLDGSYIEIIASLSFLDLNLVSELLNDSVAKNLMYIVH